jgi:hypothetical protein
MALKQVHLLLRGSDTVRAATHTAEFDCKDAVSRGGDPGCETARRLKYAARAFGSSTRTCIVPRLCDEAKPGQILISPRVPKAVEKVVTVEHVGEFTLKGIRRPMSGHWATSM